MVILIKECKLCNNCCITYSCSSSSESAPRLKSLKKLRRRECYVMGHEVNKSLCWASCSARHQQTSEWILLLDPWFPDKCLASYFSDKLQKSGTAVHPNRLPISFDNKEGGKGVSLRHDFELPEAITLARTHWHTRIGFPINTSLVYSTPRSCMPILPVFWFLYSDSVFNSAYIHII